MAQHNEDLSALERAASDGIQEALRLEDMGRLPEALQQYAEGRALYMRMAELCADETRKSEIAGKVFRLMEKAEVLKQTIEENTKAAADEEKAQKAAEEEAEKSKTKLIEKIEVPENGIGFGFERVFGHCFDDSVSEMNVQDEYIRTPAQVENFLNLCEVVLMRCPRIKKITLKTGLGRQSVEHDQLSQLEAIKDSLKRLGVDLTITLDAGHVREVTFDNGYVVNLGRGLDYFQQCEPFEVGFTERNLRKCRDTYIIILKKDIP